VHGDPQGRRNQNVNNNSRETVKSVNPVLHLLKDLLGTDAFVSSSDNRRVEDKVPEKEPATLRKGFNIQDRRLKIKQW